MQLSFDKLFFFNDPATPEIYTLSLHDALPIWRLADPGRGRRVRRAAAGRPRRGPGAGARRTRDRKSTRLNSSHTVISYAVFCLKKKTWFRTRSHYIYASLLYNSSPHDIRRRVT